MDNRTIFSKTGKGSLEISKKSLKLTGDERQALILIDGKSNLGQLEEKLHRIAPPKLRAIFEKLLELDLIREFMTKSGPDSITPTPGSAAAAFSVQEINEDDLDFTALAPVASSDTLKEIEERRKSAEATGVAARALEEQRKKEAERLALQEVARKAKAEAERKAREETGRLAREEAARQAKIDAERKAREEAARQATLEAERRVREEAARLAREEAERQAKIDAERKAREEAARQATLEAERRVREEAERLAREEAARQAKIEAERKAREEAEQLAREEAARQAKIEAERKAREEAERLAREEAARQATLEAERRVREEAERLAREEAARQAKIEAERKAREEAERLAREDAARQVKIEAERKAREEAERLAREEAARQEAIEAARKAREEAERRAREEAERKARAEAEQRSQAEARERARLQEQAVRREIAERQAKEEAQRKLLEESERQAREDAERSRVVEEAARSLPAQSAHFADDEAARYTAALAPHLEAAAAPAMAPPAPMGAFANLSALEADPDSIIGGPLSIPPDADVRPAVSDPASRKREEKEAKERAKAAERARKEAEKEARRMAKADKQEYRGGSGIGAGKIIAGVLLLTVGGVVAYVFSVSADKPAIEKALTARFGMPVTVAEAKFTPFPAELRLTNVSLGGIKLPAVLAQADSSALMSNDKIWRSVEISGMEVDITQLQTLAAMATTEPGKTSALAFTLQKIKFNAVSITGTRIPVPKFDALILVASNGTLKQATLSLPDGKAQVGLAPDEKGWAVDFESRGATWPVGPRVAWESLRGKGIANRDGLKIDEYTLTLGGGVGHGNVDIGWSGGWKLAGSIDVGSIDADAISSALYGASAVSGAVEGKFSVAMSAPSLERLFDAPQVEGNFVVTKAVLKNLDLARLLQGTDPAGGQTRMPEVTGGLAATGGRLQLRQLRGSSGLLGFSGNVDVLPDKTLSGTANIELGNAGARGKGALRIVGTVAEPKISK